MKAQQTYINVVLPFMEATQRAGLPAATVARLLGVSRGTPYFWAKRSFMPDATMQHKLIALTEKINAALEAGKLPLVFDYDKAIAALLEGDDPVSANH